MNSGGIQISAYASKTQQYFAGARRDYVEALPPGAGRVLEIGCGNGDTGALALRTGACKEYYGVELCEGAAKDAERVLTGVICGDIERIELPWTLGSFDGLIMSEVLEHLIDPWTVIKRIRPLMAPGARAFASSPNVAQWRVLHMLIRGEWRREPSGVMDATHLRWFTPQSYRAMFEDAGYVVESVRPVCPAGWRQRVARVLMLGFGEHLFWRQINLHARCE